MDPGLESGGPLGVGGCLLICLYYRLGVVLVRDLARSVSVLDIEAPSVLPCDSAIRQFEGVVLWAVLQAAGRVWDCVTLSVVPNIFRVVVLVKTGGAYSPLEAFTADVVFAFPTNVDPRSSSGSLVILESLLSVSARQG